MNFIQEYLIFSDMKLFFFIYLLTFGDVIGRKTEVTVMIIGILSHQIPLTKWKF